MKRKRTRWIAVLVAMTLAMNTAPGAMVAAWATDTEESGIKSMMTATDETEAEVDEAEIAAAAEERETSAEELGYVPGEILIVYKDEVAEETVAEVAEDLDGELVETISDTGEENIAVVSISDDTTVETAVEQYLEDPAIEIAEPNYILEMTDDEETALETMSDDTYTYDSDELWHLNYVDAPTAWSSLATYVSSLTTEPDKVRVAVIDTGAYLSHEDLSGVINTSLSMEVYETDSNGTLGVQTLRGDGYQNGTDTYNSSTTHGTHVAGIIAAQSDNGCGIQGTGSGGTTSLANSIIDLVVVDAFITVNESNEDSATISSVVYAMDYAYSAGCTIINMSLGTTSVSKILESKCNELYNKGVTIVCAAGNTNSTAAVYPSDYSSTISVINITSAGTRSGSSSYGSSKDISAPGTSIYSTLNYGSANYGSYYGTLSGTSMAAPIVTAAAAMLQYIDTGLTPSEIKSILCETATDLNTSGYDIYTGYGAVNIAAAVEEVIASVTDTGDETTYDISDATVSGISSSYTATGSAITPTPTVKYSGVTLTKGTDYTLSYSNNKDPGTATITITGIGNYTGTKQVTFTIVKASQTLTVSVSSTSIYTNATATITASGKGTITYSSGNTSVATVSSSGVVTGKSAGTVAITVTAAGNTYYKSATKTVTITVKSNSSAATTYNIANATVSGISSSYTATGSAITPTPTVKYNGVKLTKGTDYTLSYSNNKTPGTATITITGKGSYTGTKKVTFKIVKASQTLTVSASSTSIYTYATSTITASGKGTITYSSGNTSVATVSSSGVVTGKSAGTVRITVKAAGNTYYNSATKTVTITVKRGTTVYNGVDYSAVYDYGYYINKYSDLKAAFGRDETAALKHFITYGMKEGRQASASFNVYSYAYQYADLRKAYKNNLPSYYLHYINYGKKEGRVATGTTTMQNCVTTYNGVDYSSVYNGGYYISKYSDIKNAYGLDDEAILKHFVTYGMKEGRQASASFNVSVYRSRYRDLRAAYGSDLKSYYIHYIKYGKKEGRTAV